MKTGAPLMQDVNAELPWDPSINATQMGVAVDRGVVTLTGRVQNYALGIAIGLIVMAGSYLVIAGR